MIHMLLVSRKEAQSQIIPAESTGEAELTDAALEAIYGGCGQSVYDNYNHCQFYGGYYQQSSCVPYYKHHHHYTDGYGRSSYQHCQPSYHRC
jgi:hypothetical protein